MKGNIGPLDILRLTRRPLMAVGFLLITTASLISSIGCECPEMFTPPCALYSRADVVFIGTLATAIPKAVDGYNIVEARFHVDEAFKGVSGTEADVVFPFPECNVRLNVGDKYLVYARRADFSYGFGGFISEGCDGTKPLTNAVNDLNYLCASSSKKEHESISGRVMGIREHELEGIEIRARGVNWTVTSGVDAEGLYKFEPSKLGSYEIEVTVPLRLNVLAESGMSVTKEPSRTIIRYTTALKENGCDYKELRVIRTYSGTISGTVVDTTGRPVPRISVHLYPLSEKPEFHSLGGQIAGTDAAGNYLFKSVKEGKYLFGVNLGQLPSFFTPYAATFFHGVSSIDKATVVSIEENQQLSLETLRLPSRSIEQVVTGRLLWPDKTPVTTSGTGSAAGVRPNLYLLDPQNLEGINSHRPDGSNTVQIAEDGTFSLIAFEGYMYVIHIDAPNSQGQPMHAKHLKLTVSKDLLPVTLTPVDTWRRPNRRDYRERARRSALIPDIAIP